MKKALRITLILVCAAALGFLALFIVYLTQQKPAYYTSYENADRYASGSFSCDAREIDAIDITWLSGALRFQRTSGTSLRVTEADDALTEKQRTRWWQDGRTLRIQYWASNYGTEKDLNKTLVLEIPDGLSLTIRNGKKRCTVQMDRHQLKEVHLQLGTGDFLADSLTVEGDLELENGGGTTDIRSLTARSARFKTTLGEVSIGSVTLRNGLEMSSSRAKLSLGTVRAESVKISKYEGIRLGLDSCGTVDIQTNRGDIVLDTKQSAGVKVHFTTGLGKLNGKPVEGSETLVLGDGSCIVSIHAAEGNLTVR